jgi:outer membrane receptor protein involved in Fe transport
MKPHTLGLTLPLRAGFEVARDQLDTSYTDVVGEGERGKTLASVAATRQRLAGFLSQDWQPASRATFSAGLRWDRVADLDKSVGATAVHEAWSPRAGVTVRLSHGGRALTSAFATMSRAFKTPTGDQPFDPRPIRLGDVTIRLSNRELLPQRAVNVEAGIRGASARARWEIVAYRMRVHDEIDFNPATFAYGNTARAITAASRSTFGALIGQPCAHRSTTRGRASAPARSTTVSTS